MNNIILIGMPSVGKTIVGKELEKRTSWQFLDLDEEYFRVHKISIDETFETLGEKIFRERETNIAKTISMSGITNTIIATGGGIVENSNNFHYLEKLGKIIFLDCDIDELTRRVESANPKAILKNISIEDLYKRRKPLYKKYSNFTINTTNLTIANVVDKFFRCLCGSSM
ncbi:MAG: AAA family ATPase [Firmicutes bacterium]|nr:AAA family ATPase [Bacillota bacterium]MCL2256180.1 AAA family ATPase [Bacillota bacterium]